MIRISLILGVALAGVGLVWKIAPARSRLLVARDEPHFPIISGFNLDRQEFEFPRDFDGELSLVMVAFQQWQDRPRRRDYPTKTGSLPNPGAGYLAE